MIIRSAGNVVKKIAIYPTKCVLFTARKEGLHDFSFYIENVMQVFASPQPITDLQITIWVKILKEWVQLIFFFVHCVVWRAVLWPTNFCFIPLLFLELNYSTLTKKELMSGELCISNTQVSIEYIDTCILIKQSDWNSTPFPFVYTKMVVSL